MPHHLLACRSCWWLLPEPMRRRISKATSHEHLGAVAEALIWYTDNVRGGALR